MVRGYWTVGLSVLTAFFLVLWIIDCASYGNGNNGTCPCPDGQKCCDGKCIPEDAECGEDGGTMDGSGGDSRDGGVDGGRDGYVDGGAADEEADAGDQVVYPSTCTCRNPDDSWSTIYDRKCVRDDYECNALNPCDEGYYCRGICVCENTSICGLDCTSECICPGKTVCDHNTGVCRPRLPCLDDSMCPDGQFCREPPINPNNLIFIFLCNIPYGDETGEECNDNWDCLSGTCYTGVCLHFCTRNSDCPQGLFCANVDNGEMGCVARTQCDPACTGPDEFCDGHVGNSECRNDFCRTSAECERDCVLPYYPDHPLYGHCTDSSLCEGNEFVGGTLQHRCLIYKACWTDLDCKEPYSCLLLGQDNVGFCGREVN